jgi:hypothetical protein
MPKLREAAPKSVRVTVTKRIDLALLRRQKRDLIGLRLGSVVSRAQDDTVEGVLNLLDFIQDSVVARGIVPKNAVFAIRNDRPKRKIAGGR